jgi:hypothetical protein
MTKSRKNRDFNPNPEDPESQPQKGKRKRRGAQPGLPGVVDEVHQYPDVERLANALQAKRGEWHELGAECATIEQRVAEKMREHQIEEYRTAKLVVKLKPTKTKVSVKFIDAEEAAA